LISNPNGTWYRWDWKLGDRRAFYARRFFKNYLAVQSFFEFLIAELYL